MVNVKLERHIRDEVTQYNLTSGEMLWKGVEVSSKCNVIYTHGGQTVICVSKNDNKTILLLDSTDGSVINCMKGHANYIRKIYLASDDLLLTAGTGGAKMFNIPSPDNQKKQDLLTSSNEELQ